VNFSNTHNTNPLYAFSAYRFHFNGKETDNEVYGEGNALDFGARIYSSRLGRWLSPDPSENKYPGISTYNYSFNSPIIFNDPDGKDGRVSIEGNTITLETTVHCYGPDAAAFIRENKGYSSTGKVKIDGKEYIVKVNVTYVLNTQLDEATAGMNTGYSQTQPEASNFIGIGDENKVQAGDNMMYIDKNFKMPQPSVKGMTTQGESNARINDFRAASNETMNMLGFSDRYGPDEYGFPFPDDGFMTDFASNNPNNEPGTMHPVHLYDAAKFAKSLTDIAKKSSVSYSGMLIDNLGTNKNHIAEDPKEVEEKSNAVSGQTTTTN
jgi:RHS repeat-associated protein